MMPNNFQNVLKTLRQKKPLVLCLTNYVTMDFMANCLLALGAAPLMSEEIEEIKELVDISQVVNLNIGTLNKPFITLATTAAIHAKKTGKPIVLDPVGAGASQIRTKTAKELLKFADIIRGNASEVIALLDGTSKTMGVESTQRVTDAKTAAITLAKQYPITVIVSGPEDLVVDSQKEILLPYGSHLMTCVTGMGCALNAIIAAFRAILPNPYEAAQMATAYVGLCGMLAAEKISGPASFRTRFIDSLYQPDWQKMDDWYGKKANLNSFAC